MFETSIRGLLAQIETGRIVLPAMQRPFVWHVDRMTRLVDSLLRRFPLGTVLLWKTSKVQRYRRFQKDVDPSVDQVFTYESDASGDRHLVLDGQQRLTSLLIAIKGSYGGRRLFLDALSGSPTDKDPGDAYFDSQFCNEAEVTALNNKVSAERKHFMPIKSLFELDPVDAPARAFKKAQELKLTPEETQRLTTTYLSCATAAISPKSLQMHLIDEDAAMTPTPIEEILEIFVRVNSGGLVLNKSDLLMSLLDLAWNDIQPELQKMVRTINYQRPFTITRDEILKSLLLTVGEDTRFDRLVSNRDRVEELAGLMPSHLPGMLAAWQALTTLLIDKCKITSERFFRGGHNSLLPFVLWLYKNPKPTPSQKVKLTSGIYLALMSGVLAGAEARMGNFARREAAQVGDFPLKGLATLAKRHYGISSLENLLTSHLDLALNLAHGGITLDGNPDDLQRDHIFPRATLLKEGKTEDEASYYANFHFLRGSDNLNKSDTPPHEWFAKPGKGLAAYSDDDLKERLLRWDLLKRGAFKKMIAERSAAIHGRAESILGMTVADFDALFA